MAIFALDQTVILLNLYGKDAVNALADKLDSLGMENLQNTLTQKVESSGPVAELTVEMAHYGEYIDSGSKYTDKFPPPTEISKWCDRKTDGRKGNGIPDDPHEFNSATYPVSLKIFTDGIEPRPFLHLFTDLYPFFEQRFAEAMKADLLKAL